MTYQTTNSTKLLRENAESESLEKLEKLRRRRISNNRYKHYVPNGKCEEFIEIVGSGENLVSLFSAANGVGKTANGACIVANIIWGKGSDWFDYPLFNKWPYPKRGRIVSDPATIVDTIIPELYKWFPTGRFTSQKKGKNYEYEWQTDNGWTFHLMTYEQATTEFESATLGFVWFDEPPSKAIYIASVARLRKGGTIFITATPLTGSAWMYDTLVTANERVL